MKTNRQEKGQIVVILALSIVAIIGITALAIDGSLIYNERRQDQNTADSAALAGAGAAAKYLQNVNSGVLICGQATGTAVTQEIVNAVRASVAVDGIDAADMPKLADDTALASVDQGFTVSCNWYGELGVQYLDIHVKISTDMPTNFAKVLSPENLKTTIDSTARVYPKQPMAYGNGLVSIADACNNKDGGIFFLGGGQLGSNKGTYLTNGGVFSNSCIEAQSGIVQVAGGSIQQYWDLSTCVNCFDNPKFQPEAEKANTTLPEDMIPPPVCPPKTAGNTHNEGSYTSTIYPGWYTNGISAPNNATVVLKPGLYCIEGGMDNNSKSTIQIDETVAHPGVTLYFFSGDVQLNQNSKGGVILKSCTSEPCGDPSAVQGLLMYFDISDPNYNPDIQLNGSSDNVFRGTVYGPHADVHLNGNTNTTNDDIYNFSTQIVGAWIEINGNAMLVMNLNSNDFVSMPPSLSLIK